MRTFEAFVWTAAVLAAGSAGAGEIAASAARAFAGDVVTFTVPEEGLTEVRWELGRGTTASGVRADARFERPGSYAVRASARYADGRLEELFLDRPVEVLPAPAPRIRASRTALRTGEETAFRLEGLPASEHAAVVSVRWAFGDGAASSEGEPVHAYAIPGSYRVTASVAVALDTGYGVVEREVFASSDFSVAVYGDVLYLDGARRGPGDGASWNTALGDPAAALDRARQLGIPRVLAANSPLTFAAGRAEALRIPRGVALEGGYDPATGEKTGRTTATAGEGFSWAVRMESGSALVGFDVRFGRGGLAASRVSDVRVVDCSFTGSGTASGPDRPGILVEEADAVFLDEVTVRRAYGSGAPSGLRVVRSRDAGLRNLVLEENRGGGLWVEDGTRVEVAGSLFRANDGDRGGAVSVTGEGGAGTFVAFRSCRFEENRAREGAGLYAGAPGVRVLLSGCRFTGNVSTGDGGGLLASGSDVYGLSTLWEKNRSGGRGESVFLSGGRLRLALCTLVGSGTLESRKSFVFWAGAPGSELYGTILYNPSGPSLGFSDAACYPEALHSILYRQGETTVRLPGRTEPLRYRPDGRDPGFGDAKAGDYRLNEGAPLFGNVPFRLEDWLGDDAALAQELRGPDAGGSFRPYFGITHGGAYGP